MRLAIFGDVHANLEALRAVLHDAMGQGCDRHACVGDIVGYNANPKECVEIIRELGCPVVRGNSDEDVFPQISLENYNPVARRALEWTRANLDEVDKYWLCRLPLVRDMDDWSIVHATLDKPESWTYVFDQFDARCSFMFQETRICFCGHTHLPRFFIEDGKVETDPGPKIRIQPEKRYLINVGSVGQPRDGDWRACYAIYDDAASSISIRRVEYDLRTMQKKIIDAGLPGS